MCAHPHHRHHCLQTVKKPIRRQLSTIINWPWRHEWVPFISTMYVVSCHLRRQYLTKSRVSFASFSDMFLGEGGKKTKKTCLSMWLQPWHCLWLENIASFDRHWLAISLHLTAPPQEKSQAETDWTHWPPERRFLEQSSLKASSNNCMHRATNTWCWLFKQ